MPISTPTIYTRIRCMCEDENAKNEKTLYWYVKGEQISHFLISKLTFVCLPGKMKRLRQIKTKVTDFTFHFEIKLNNFSFFLFFYLCIQAHTRSLLCSKDISIFIYKKNHHRISTRWIALGHIQMIHITLLVNFCTSSEMYIFWFSFWCRYQWRKLRQPTRWKNVEGQVHAAN